MGVRPQKIMKIKKNHWTHFASNWFFFWFLKKFGRWGGGSDPPKSWKMKKNYLSTHFAQNWFFFFFLIFGGGVGLIPKKHEKRKKYKFQCILHKTDLNNFLFKFWGAGWGVGPPKIIKIFKIYLSMHFAQNRFFSI